MDPVFRKLNFKDQKEIVVINPPEAFESNLASMQDITKIKQRIEDSVEIIFVLAFVKNREEIESITPELVEKADGDAVIWYAYPKKSSKKYKTGINRDSGWELLGQYGLEPVRQVSVDEDWSALRFRKVEYIKNITRRKDFALTKEARDRTANKKRNQE